MKTKFPKLLVKSQKALNFLKELKSKVSENNDICLNIYSYENQIRINYFACERRTDLYSMAKKYENKINNFVELINNSPFTKGKNKKIKYLKTKDYAEDTEYSEYEMEIGRSFIIEDMKQAKQIVEAMKN